MLDDVRRASGVDCLSWWTVAIDGLRRGRAIVGWRAFESLKTESRHGGNNRIHQGPEEVNVRLDKKLLVLGGLIPLLVAGCAAAAADQCSVEMSGETRSFDNVYAVRAHDPYDLDDSTRLTRVLCFEAEIPEPALATEKDLMKWMRQEEPNGLVIEIRDTGNVVTVMRMEDGGFPVHWGGPFGGSSKVGFTGSNDAESIIGTVTTSSPLEDDNSGHSIEFSATLDRAIDVAW